MITKRLLSAIMGEQCVWSEPKGFIDEDTYPVYFFDRPECQNYDEYNIHVLQSKLKKWAFNQHTAILESAYVSKGSFTSSYCKLSIYFKGPRIEQNFHGDTEFEAVVKACEWLINQVESDDVDTN